MRSVHFKKRFSSYAPCLSKHMPQAVYPLAQILQVKKKRVEDAENLVRTLMHELQKQEEILDQKKQERDKVKTHYQDKLLQFRTLLDGGTTSPKIQEMKVYLKLVQEKLVIEENKVNEQQKIVAAAKLKVDEAKVELKRKQQEVDKLIEHRKDWMAEMKKEQDIQEGREQDELGSIVFLTRHRKKN